MQQPHETGSGRVVDLSRSGVRFTTDRPLDTGLNLELAVQWPVLLDGDVHLQLALAGSIVWAEGNEAAMEILRYEFRTRGGQIEPM
ncbi:MAG TPA: PilZ domain-containing protein [Candidatus Acidoferrales bacterium]|nr:PilZ domain-containing protein [Candidatus Acidoferrales bacterium]